MLQHERQLMETVLTNEPAQWHVQNIHNQYDQSGQGYQESEVERKDGEESDRGQGQGFVKVSPSFAETTLATVSCLNADRW